MHRGEDRQRAGPAEVRHQVEHLLTVSYVERARRFVEQQHRGLLSKGSRQDTPLPLPTREGSERPVRQMDDPEIPQCSLGDGHVGISLCRQVAEVRGPAQQDVVDHVHLLWKYRVLGHDGNRSRRFPATQLRGEPTTDPYHAVVSNRSGDGPQQRRLARPVRSDEADPFAGRHR